MELAQLWPASTQGLHCIRFSSRRQPRKGARLLGDHAQEQGKGAMANAGRAASSSKPTGGPDAGPQAASRAQVGPGLGAGH